MKTFSKAAVTGFAMAAAMLFGAAASASIVTNGSFESGVPTLSNGNWGIVTLPGWSNTSGGIEVHTQPTLGLTPDDGSYYIEMDGNNNYTISQTVFLAIGSYALTFAYSPRMSDPNTNGIDYAVGSLLSGTATGPGGSIVQGAWTPFTQNFSVVAGGNYTLSFSGSGANDSLGGLLDNVAISAVPLPASGLLLLGAFGGVAALRRRKSV